MLNLTKGEDVIKRVPEFAQFTLPNGDVVSPAYAGWDNGEYALVEAPIEPAPIPDPTAERASMSLSFAQLMIGLVAANWLDQAQAELWLSGTLPPAVMSTISLLPVEQQFAAKAKAMRPSSIDRMDPLVKMMALAQGRSDAELDDFFRTYASA
ncbi:hypothetical protein [Caudoviricetes sp.]|nr:hypothetical protein [Caudoviricetes sp.]